MVKLPRASSSKSARTHTRWRPSRGAQAWAGLGGDYWRGVWEVVFVVARSVGGGFASMVCSIIEARWPREGAI
eukprot:10655934-Lingulodinium_polyedra.AAC.1